jgi:hypothetical protein
MESSIVVLLRVLAQIEDAKLNNARFGNISILLSTLDCVARTARMRITRHAWHECGITSTRYQFTKRLGVQS